MPYSFMMDTVIFLLFPLFYYLHLEGSLRLSSIRKSTYEQALLDHVVFMLNPVNCGSWYPE